MGRRSVGKAVVMGILELGGSVRASVIEITRRNVLRRELQDHVKPGASLDTDALASYAKLDLDVVHEFIDQGVCYAKVPVHSNGLENFWSLLKRSLNGTYVSVEPFHLFR